MEHSDIEIKTFIIVPTHLSKHTGTYIYMLTEGAKTCTTMVHEDQLPPEKEKKPSVKVRLDGKAPHAYITEQYGIKSMRCTLCNRSFSKKAKISTQDSRMHENTTNETKIQSGAEKAIIQHIKNYHSYPILITRQNSTMLIINQEGDINPRIIHI